MISCLAKDPDERPASAEWLAARLVECEGASDWTPARAREWWEEKLSPAASGSRPSAATHTGVTPLA